VTFAVDLDRLRRRRTVKWSLFGPDVLAAWVAEMDFDVAPVVKRAIVDSVEREDFGYLEADLSALTGACAEFLAARHGWPVPPARIFSVADVLTGIAGALDVFSPPGSAVVVPTPAYPPFFEIVEGTGRPVVPVPMRLDGGMYVLDLRAIERALAEGARTVLLNTPHNPTGRVFTREELVALAEVVERQGARVVADEVHAPIVLPGHSHVPYASVSDATATHTVTVTSASKAFNLAGLKCAQVVASNHADARRWRELGVFSMAGPTPIGVAASVAAYAEGGAWLDALVAQLDANRALLGTVLAQGRPEIRYVEPEATFLAWLDCAALGLEDPARWFLHQGRVALSAGADFGAGWEQHVRLNFATSPEILELAVAAIAGCT
jgi:cystathionine beta-lyase